MANLNFDKEDTALIVIDPYNDFISEGGKIWPRIKGVAEANGWFVSGHDFSRAEKALSALAPAAVMHADK